MRLFLLVVLASLIMGCSEQKQDLSTAPVEFQMACVNEIGKETAHPDEATVARFKALLETSSKKFQGTQKEIAGATVRSQRYMSEKGFNENLLDILEDTNAISPGAAKKSYGDVVKMYAAARVAGMDRNAAVAAVTKELAGNTKPQKK